MISAEIHFIPSHKSKNRKNRVCILILTQEPLAIRITNKAVADSFKNYFESLWKIAKK